MSDRNRADVLAALERLHPRVLGAKRALAQTEPRRARTEAFIQLLFACGFARAGDVSRATACHAKAASELGPEDPVYESILAVGAYRISAPTAPLPQDLDTTIESLNGFSRYQARTILALSFLLEPSTHAPFVDLRGWKRIELDRTGRLALINKVRGDRIRPVNEPFPSAERLLHVRTVADAAASATFSEACDVAESLVTELELVHGSSLVSSHVSPAALVIVDALILAILPPLAERESA